MKLISHAALCSLDFLWHVSSLFYLKRLFVYQCRNFISPVFNFIFFRTVTSSSVASFSYFSKYISLTCLLVIKLNSDGAAGGGSSGQSRATQYHLLHVDHVHLQTGSRGKTTQRLVNQKALLAGLHRLPLAERFEINTYLYQINTIFGLDA